MRELNHLELQHASGGHQSVTEITHTDGLEIIDTRPRLPDHSPVVRPISEDPPGTPPGPDTVTAPNGTVFYRQPGGWYF